MAAGVALGIGLLVAGFYASSNSEEVTLPPEVERIVPSAGSIIRPQGAVLVDLVDTYTGVLAIDGEEIPLDQLTVVEPLGQISFSPDEAKEITRFEPGTHSATVTFWEKAETRASAQSFTWQFRVG